MTSQPLFASRNCVQGYQRTFSSLQKKALLFSLPKNSNLKRWGKSPSDQCNL